MKEKKEKIIEITLYFITLYNLCNAMRTFPKQQPKKVSKINVFFIDDKI